MEINSSSQDKWQSLASWAAERQRNRRRRQETKPPVESEEPNEQEVRERIMGHSKATMVRPFAFKSEIEKELKINVNNHFIEVSKYNCYC